MFEKKFSTSEEMGTLASEVLKDPNSSSVEKKLAGSDLSLVNKDNDASNEIKSLAGKVLQDDNSSEKGKELAGSILGQSK
jgi:hypothetical protein